ncbi:MAG: DUF1592 domain-containing protein, partial [Myxococcota bacterium]|nr:DUF1592 domain-containing protein [Myxococcota bacterium]
FVGMGVWRLPRLMFHFTKRCIGMDIDSLEETANRGLHPSLIALLVCSMGCAPQEPPVAVETPAMHRLTGKQIDRSLASLFDHDSLPPILLPQEIPKDGFYNQAVMREATPFLVESLERSIANVVQEAIEDGGDWLHCHPEDGVDSEECGIAILSDFLPKAWRRPVSDEERSWIESAFTDWNAQVGFDGAMQLSLSVILLSPDFLYLIETGDASTDTDGYRRLTDWEIASRMSYFLWNTMPDEELFELAQAGKLRDTRIVQEQAMRMLRDARARDAVLEFHRQWLGASYISKINPDYNSLWEVILSDAEAEYFDFIHTEGTVQEFIELDEYWGMIKREIKVSYEAEFEMFVNHTIFGTGTLHDLLTSQVGFVSSRTAPFYGVQPEGDSYYYVSPIVDQNFESFSLDMYQVQLPADQRAGILTQGAFLAGHSHPNQPSPVLRGVFLRERILCIEPVPPPGDVPAIGSTTGGDWTTNRERFAQHTEDPACAGCHIPIDGVGFPFENYDAIGAWRDTDNGAPVDATGELLQTDVNGSVDNAMALIDRLGTSRQVHDCMVEHLYQYAMHRSEAAGDNPHLTLLQEDFWSDDGVIPNLYVRLVTSPAFLNIPIPDGGAQ